MNVQMTKDMQKALFALRPRVRKGQAGDIERHLHNRLENARGYLRRRIVRNLGPQPEATKEWWAPLL